LINDDDSIKLRQQFLKFEQYDMTKEVILHDPVMVLSKSLNILIKFHVIFIKSS